MPRPDLLSPVRFRNGVEARNRVALAPLTNLQSHDDGSLSDEEFRWLDRRAQGGFGVVETCAAYVDRGGRAWEGELGIDDDARLPGLTRLGRALGERGALGLVQLFHGGVRASSKTTGRQPVSASSWDEDTPGFERPRAATTEEVQGFVTSFRDAALRAQAAGFHGVELHGAHGYLLCQFLSRTMNPRDDGWGGDLEGRARLLRECMRAVKSAARPEFIVGVRLSPEDYGFARGLDLDEVVTVAKWLCDDGADFIHLSLWDARKNTRRYPDRHAVPMFREALPPEVPIVAAGHVWTRDDAEHLLGLGADLVALGRSGIVNPDWPTQAAAPTWSPRRPPLSPAEFAAREVSPRFVEYLRRWKDFVSDAP